VWTYTPALLLPDTKHHLTVIMDFGRNRWSAQLDGVTFTEEQLITTRNAALDLGDIDAGYWLFDTWFPADDFMVFDNYRVVALPSRAPRILRQPRSAQVRVGDTVRLGVVADGGRPLAYQWRRNGTALDGQTGTVLTIEGVGADSQGNYDVVVTNAAGTVTSDSVAVTVDERPPTIVLAPQSQTAEAGETVLFNTVVAGAEPVTLQWQKEGIDLAGESARTLRLDAVTPEDGGTYRVRATNAGGTVQSTGALLTVVQYPPAIIEQPRSQTVVKGGNAQFSVAARGTAPVGYQWRRNGADIPGETTVNLRVLDVEPADAGTYSVVVHNARGEVVSRPASLWVDEVLAAPTLSPAGGEFAGPVVEVLITAAEADTVVRFTTDGSDPVAGSQVVPADGRVQVSVPGTLKARSFKDGWAPGRIATGQYLLAFEGPEPDWRVTCILTGAVRETYEFGMSAGATDGLDAGVDVPTQGGRTRVEGEFYSSVDGTPLAVDIREPDSRKEWLLTVQSGTSALDIQWALPLQIPDGRYLSMYTTDAVGAPRSGLSTDMGLHGGIVVSPGSTGHVVIRYGNDLAQLLAVSPGWNLVGLCITPADPDIDAVLTVGSRAGGAAREPAYTGSVWAFDSGHYVRAGAMASMRGYWVYAPSSSAFLVSGLRVRTSAVPVHSGWNLVSPPATVSIPSIADVLSLMFGWSGTPGRYAPVGVLVPGNGYWAFARRDAELEFFPVVERGDGASSRCAPVRLTLPPVRSAEIRQRRVEDFE
jgi:hypothetical protein